MNRRVLSLLMAAAIGTGVACAQTPAPETSRRDTTRTATPEERTTKLESEVAALKALKISGYVQFEWQRFSQSSSTGGRALYSDARRNFFTIRRGRLKAQHRLNDVMTGVIQADFTETGARIKDAYGQFNLLPADGLTITAGLFNRPNYEVEYSSSTRESAERSQVVRAFYPDERDLGVMFSTRTELFENFTPKLQVGVFNGVGTGPETDPYKDLIARLTFPLPFPRTSPVRIDLGGSFYQGGVPQKDSAVIRTVDGANRTVANTESGSWPGWGNRRNINAEAQISLKVLPVGETILRGEFLTGRRPSMTASEPAMLQIRNQMGYYAYFVQNFGSRFQIAAKYDFFDRNTDLSEDQVRSQSDAAFGVLGLGGSVFIDNLRIMLWHEIPTLGTGEIPFAAAEARENDLADDKTTVRFQYRF